MRYATDCYTACCQKLRILKDSTSSAAEENAEIIKILDAISAHSTPRTEVQFLDAIRGCHIEQMSIHIKHIILEQLTNLVK